MASIQYRSGNWRAQVRRKGFRSVCKTFRSREAAEAWAAEIDRRIDTTNDGLDRCIEPMSASLKKGIIPDEIMYLPRIAIEGGSVGVYFLFKGDECVYVGQSTNVHARVREHRQARNGTKDFDSYSWIPVDPDQLTAIELYYIDQIHPPLNVVGSELKALERKLREQGLGDMDRKITEARIKKHLLHFCHGKKSAIRKLLQ